MDLREKLNEFLKSKDREELSDFMDDSKHIDVAESLDGFDSKDLKAFLKLLSFEDVAHLVHESDIDLQKRILSNYTNEEIVEIFQNMQTDDVADILGELPTYRRKELLTYMKKEDSRMLEIILSYEGDTAGGIMTTNFISLRAGLSAKEALNKIIDISPKTEIIEEFFVTDNHHRLIGTMNLRSLLTAKAEELLIDLMTPDPIMVTPSQDQEECAQLVRKYDLMVLPVVSKSRVILGVITVDDIIDVLIEEQTEDMLGLGGVSSEKSIDTESSPKESVKARLPWLIVNLFTAFLSSFVVNSFSDTIESIIALAAINPVITGMGGNAGSQSLSVALTSLITDGINLKEDWKNIFKELLIGLANGLSTGLIAGLVIYFAFGNPWLSMISLLALTMNIMIAGMVGFLVPLIMKRLGFDPALSSSIFVTTITDVCGFLIFLGLASYFLPKLI